MSSALARTLVFATSAAVLILEILAGRLLAPYLGVSLEVFTGIIGVILAGISVGAWLGGKAADRGDPRRLVGPLLAGGGVTALLAPVAVDLVGPAAGPGPVSIVLLSALGFFLPAAVLSAVPPVVVKIRLDTLDRTGSVVGSYSAVGTAGAIFGTFVTGFVLIAAFPTRPIVLGVGLALALGGAALSAGRAVWGRTTILGLALVAAGPLVALDGPCDYETVYHCAQVRVDPDRPSGRVLVLDRGRNSYVDLADPTHLEFRYLRVMADLMEAEMPPGPLTTVSIGGGGLTFPMYVAATRPGSDNVVLEIDGALVDIAREELGFADQAEVIVDDARRSIETVAPGSVDLAVGDAFTGLTVPWHLTTVEFVTPVATRLAPGGVYTVNVIDGGRAEFARAETATLLEVFQHVAVLAPAGYFSGTGGGNYVLAASDDPLDVDAVEARISGRGGVETVLTGSDLIAWIGGAGPLRDDYAPVDQMIIRGRSSR